MGRNVSGILGIIFNKEGIMKLRIFIVLLIMVFAVPLFAQENPTGDKEVYKPLKFLPIQRFPIGILHVYRYTDTTEVIKYLGARRALLGFTG